MADPAEFERTLRDRLGARVRPGDSEDGARILYVDLARLRLNFPVWTPFLLVNAPTRGLTSDTLPSFVQDFRTRHGLQDMNCFVVADIPVPSWPREDLRHRHVVVLDSAAVARMDGAHAPHDVLIDLAAAQLPRATISPYEASRPVQAGLFFGREYELRLLRDKASTSFLVLGMRRIGKTSLLTELRRLLVADHEQDGSQDLYLDPVIVINCAPHSDSELLSVIVERLSPREARRFSAERYAHVLRRLSRKGTRPVHVFLDEIDDLIEWDRKNNWTVLNTLRATHMEGYARYVFAGHQRLSQAASLEKAPLYNFAQMLALGVFSRQDALALVRGPLARLRVRIEDQLVDRIVSETGGHPNLLQKYCSFIVRRLDEESRDDVQPSDLESLYDDPDFDTFVLGTFTANTTATERLIVFSMMNKGAFAQPDVDRVLRAQKILLSDGVLISAMNNLRLSGILGQSGGSYQLQIPVLKALLKRHYDLEYLVEQAKLQDKQSILKIFS